MPADKLGLLDDTSLQTNWTKTACGSEIFSYLRLPSTDIPISTSHPLLVLLHGYPQTSFIWRHLLKLLPTQYPLFIPDLPGYGRSTPSQTAHDKLTIGLAILEALSNLLSTSDPHHDPSTPTPIILIGHDRGARIAHRLALHHSHPAPTAPASPFHLAGLTILDTIPEPAQWSSFAASPATAASSFHWPFLANASLATDMILAYGGARWCTTLLARWCGGGDLSSPSPRIASLNANDAVAAYAAAFERASVVRATCEDYAASAGGTDAEMQAADAREGRKVRGLEARGVLVLFSEAYLGAKGARDVGGVWRAYVDEGTTRLVARGIGDDVGHFLVEEAPEEVAAVLVEWLEGRT